MNDKSESEWECKERKKCKASQASMNDESESEWKSKLSPAQEAKQDEWKECEQARVTNCPPCKQKFDRKV